MREPIRVLAVAGSLRRHSYNRALIRAAIELAPAEMEIDTCQDLAKLAYYDGDVEDAGLPDEVIRFKAAIAAADALLIATPEYNDGTSGVLKNAIDWASRGPVHVLTGKPVAVMGASTGRGAAKGGIEAVQRALRRSRATVMDRTVAVPTAADVFDERRRLVDRAVRAEVAGLVADLYEQVTGEQPAVASSPAATTPAA